MQEWWKSAVFYQIYPRSFLDTNADGIGDLRGISEKLDYLANELGVTCLWLSPIQCSAHQDFGYDISNYCDVDPIFGSMVDFNNLIDQVHRRGMKLILDGVFNHSSDQHPWFQASRKPNSQKREWYIWRDKIPNNWASVFGGKAWTKDSNGSYYLHSFLPSQPELNWRNEDLRQAIYQSMRFWLDLGIDGFRLDVFNCYLKHKELLSNPYRFDPVGMLSRLVYPYINQHHIHDRDQPELFEVLKEMRSIVDQYDGVLVGETLDERFLYAKASQYCGSEKLHLTFDFRLLHSRFGAKSFHNAIVHSVNTTWPSWVLSNHDFRRHASRWGSDPRKLKLLAVLSLTLKGTPFLYYGEEIGMTEGSLRKQEIVDPIGKTFWPFFKGRDGCRTPMQWDGSKNAGFTSNQPWLPVQPGYVQTNVAQQIAEEGSILSTYRNVIRLRKRIAALSVGDMQLPQKPHPVILNWVRFTPNERVGVVLNMSKKPHKWNWEGELLYRTGEGNSTTLAAFEAVIYRENE